MSTVRLARRVLHAHAPRSLRHLGAEHVVMPTAYGVAAVLFHSPLGSLIVAVGYGTVAVVAARDQRRAEREECTGRHAACAQADEGR